MDPEIINVEENSEIVQKRKISKKLIMVLLVVVLLVIAAGVLGYIIYDKNAHLSYQQGINLVDNNSTGDYTNAIAYFKTFVIQYPIGQYNKKAKDLGTVLFEYKIRSDELAQINTEKNNIKTFYDFITKMEGFVKDIEYSHDLAYDFVFNSNNSVYNEIVSFVEKNDTTWTNVEQDLNTGRGDLRKYISEDEVSNLKSFLACGYYPSSTIHLCLKLGYPFTDEYKATMSKSWDNYDMLKPQIEEMIKTKKADINERQDRAIKLILELEQLKTKISLAKSDFGELLEKAKKQVGEDNNTNSETSLSSSTNTPTENVNEVQKVETDIPELTNSTIKSASSIIVDDTKLQIESLSLSISRQEVVNIMGNPISTKKDEWDSEGGVMKEEYMTYKDITVRMLNDECDKIKIISKNASTSKGVKVGDSYEVVKSKYGEYQSGLDEKGATYCCYGDYNNSLYFLIDSNGKGNVLEIGLMRNDGP